MQRLPRARRDWPDGAERPDQAAHGCMIGGGHKDGRQRADPMKTGEHGRVTPIWLPPITGQT
ncbi:MAG: hypothetical protein WCB09_07905 [Methylocella sp.]